jgi:hypothetical protein
MPRSSRPARAGAGEARPRDEVTARTSITVDRLAEPSSIARGGVLVADGEERFFMRQPAGFAACACQQAARRSVVAKACADHTARTA